MLRAPSNSAHFDKQQADAMLAAAAAACPHGLMIERAGRVVYANQAFARLIGARHSSDVLGKSAASLPRPHLSSHNGKRAMPVYQTSRAVFRCGRARMAINVVRDVSDHKRLEDELRNSQKMESLGRRVGGVAHDFNNVLEAVTLYCDLLVSELNASTSAAKHAAEIRLAADQGASLVRQLLAFARPQPTELHRVSLNSVIADLTDMLRRLVGEDIRLVVHCTEPLGAVLVDTGQLNQLILNVVMNSRDAMPRGGRITLSTADLKLAKPARGYPGLRRGSYVTLTVADNGCGMDAATRARIFEPFFTTKPAGRGTGLGMSTVYNVVRQYGGTVAVESEPGKGTRVTIVLPQAHAPGAEGQQENADIQGTGCGKSVLLVEDDNAIRGTLREMLSSLGYQVVAARDPREALRLSRRHNGSMSLLITDVMMPELGGCELARKVGRSHSDLRVLFISGYPAAAQPATADAIFLAKPFSRASLARKIREVLDRPAPDLARDPGFAACGEKSHDRH